MNIGKKLGASGSTWGRLPPDLGRVLTEFWSQKGSLWVPWRGTCWLQGHRAAAAALGAEGYLLRAV